MASPEQEFYPENRFGELGRRDTFEYSKDWDALHPIAREVGEKIKDMAHKACHYRKGSDKPLSNLSVKH